MLSTLIPCFKANPLLGLICISNPFGILTLILVGINALPPVKIKIDNFKVDHDKKLIVLNDLKTTSTRLDEFMDSSFIKFHYYRQFAFYGYLLYSLMARDGDYKIQANVYVLNKQTGSYKSFQINKKLVSRGFDEFQGLIKRIGFHESYGYDTLREDI